MKANVSLEYLDQVFATASKQMTDLSLKSGNAVKHLNAV